MGTHELMMILYLLMTTNLSQFDIQYENTSKYADLAFNNIRQAESAEANVSKLVDKFNDAVGLLQQAESSDFISCLPYDNCIDKANKIFISIIDESKLIVSQAREKKNYESIMVLAIFPSLGAFIIAFLSLYFYRTWESYKIKNFLELEIKEKDN